MLNQALKTRMRCFIAIMPPRATAQKLSHHIQRIHPSIAHAQAIATSDLHLTLAFIGSIANQEAHQVSAALAAIPPNHFPNDTWVLDRMGCFEHAHALWAAGTPNATLIQYANTVRHALKTLGVHFDSKPFAPHVTLLRKVRCHSLHLPDIPLNIPWPLTRPDLMQSVSHANDTHYLKVAPMPTRS